MLLFAHILITAVKYGMCTFGETQSKRLQKPQNRAAWIIMNMSNDIDHSGALQALGWKRKKSKAKIMYKLLNKMGTKSLINFQVVFVYHNRVLII